MRSSTIWMHSFPGCCKPEKTKEAVSIAYQGNVVDLWERLAKDDIHIELGSDQTSLHNPFAGGYYPAGLSFEEANRMMADDPEAYKEKVYASLRRHVAAAVNQLVEKGMYFFRLRQRFSAGVILCRSRYSERRRLVQISELCRTSWGPCVSIMVSVPFRWVRFQ